MWVGSGGALQSESNVGKDREVRKYCECLEDTETSLSRIYGRHKGRGKENQILEFFNKLVNLISFEYFFWDSQLPGFLFNKSNKKINLAFCKIQQRPNYWAQINDNFFFCLPFHLYFSKVLDRDE